MVEYDFFVMFSDKFNWVVLLYEHMYKFVIDL